MAQQVSVKKQQATKTKTPQVYNEPLLIAAQEGAASVIPISMCINHLVLSKSERRVVAATLGEEPINHSNVICQKKFPFKTVPNLTESVN